MRPFRAKRWIPARPEHVFEFIADSTNDPLWCPLVANCRQVSGTAPAKGAKYVQEQKVGKGETVRSTVEIVKFDPPRKIQWQVEDELRVYDIVMKVTPHGTGVNVEQISKPLFKKFKLRVKATFGRQYVRSVLDDQLRRLEDEIMRRHPDGT